MVEAGGHNIDRDIRHHQWPWELRYRNAYKPDPVNVQLSSRSHIAGLGEQEQRVVFDGSAHNNYYNDHFFAKIRDWTYTHPEGMPYRSVRVRSLGGKTNCWGSNCTRWERLNGSRIPMMAWGLIGLYRTKKSRLGTRVSSI